MKELKQGLSNEQAFQQIAKATADGYDVTYSYIEVGKKANPILHVRLLQDGRPVAHWYPSKGALYLGNALSNAKKLQDRYDSITGVLSVVKPLIKRLGQTLR